ncbi:hypothetical protein [uncultured Amphritea sp.]|mgnify:CR=1 FL=1|uniref:hypothetical protein n=1 Tax=uncultured Amphritea sp. TaxID=981605 RepID=UPI0026372D03|nr:hypothetical protein [uncultured Amphritea sp.]
MKKTLLILATAITFALPLSGNAETPHRQMIPQHADAACQWINGYYRQDGTYVQGHWRGCP